MKLSTLFLILSTCTLFAANSLAQTMKVDLQVENATIKEVLLEIRKQTNISFLYNNEELNDTRRVTLNINDNSVENVLNLILRNQDLAYSIENNVISIYKPEKTIAAANLLQTDKKTVTGTVTDERGEPIIGANVSVKGTTIGSITNVDGEFSLSVPEDAILVVSYIGYITQDIAVNNQTSLRIGLREDSLALDEVVVVGFGTQKKLNLTGAISSIKGEDMTIRPVANTASMLQGQVPGLYVTQSTGQPGEEGVSFRIRGNGSYGSSTSPLVLINGVEGDISGLDPNMIESVNILKDAASAAIYGSRAANGVILVTTKQGTREQKPQFSYSGNLSIQTPTKMYDLITNSADYMTYTNLAKDNSGQGGKYDVAEIEKYRQYGGTEQYPNFDWLDYMFNPAIMHTHNLSLAGSVGKTTYNLSLNYLNQEGTMRGFEYERYNMTLDLSTYATDWMRVGAYTTLKHGDRQRTRLGQDDAFLSTMSQAPTYMPWLPDDGTGIRKWTSKAYSFEANNKNQAAMVGEGIFNTRKDYDLNTQLWAEVKFLKNFTWHTKGAIRYYSRRDQDWGGYYIPMYMYHSGEQAGYIDTNKTGLEVTDLRELSTTLQSYVRYDFTSPNATHNLSAMVGYSQETFKQEDLNAYRQDYPFELKTIAAGGTTNWRNGGDEYEWALQSVYGRLTYNFKERYLFEANARYDGSSKLSSSGRWGLFPSFSGAWRLTEENFIKESSISSWLSNAKIRGSWGQLGNQDIGNYPYQAMIEKVTSYPFDNSSETLAYIQSAYNNENIKWEKTTITDIGVDLLLLNRLSVTFDWYKKNTTDILRGSQVSNMLGLSAPIINDGEMQNTGIELALDWNDRIQDGPFKGLTYFAGVSYDRSRNKLLKIGAEEISGYHLRREGLPYDEFYMLKSLGVFATQEEIDNSPKQYTDNTQPGDLKYWDANGDGVVNNDDRVTTSGFYPGFEYSIKFGGNWKGIDLYVFGQGVQDKKFYTAEWGATPFQQGSAPTVSYIEGMWTEDNPHNAKHPKLYWADLGGSKNNRASTYFLKNASYFRIKNITLGYTIPKPMTDKIGISGVRVYVSGDNIFTFTDFDGLDPERTANGRAAQYPQNKSISFGLNVNF